MLVYTTGTNINYTVMRKRITRKENPEIVRIETQSPIIDKETWTMVQEQLSQK